MNFQGKQNPFSESFRAELQDLADAVSDYIDNRSGYLRAANIEPPSVPDAFMATITGASLINGLDGGEFGGGVVTSKVKNIWKYQWTSFSGTRTRSSAEDTFFALNGAELGNTGTGSESYGVGVAAVAPVISLLSIGDLGAVTPSVWMHMLPAPISVTLGVFTAAGDADGEVTVSTRYVFFAGNEVEVTC